MSRSSSMSLSEDDRNDRKPVKDEKWGNIEKDTWKVFTSCISLVSFIPPSHLVSCHQDANALRTYLHSLWMQHLLHQLHAENGGLPKMPKLDGIASGTLNMTELIYLC